MNWFKRHPKCVVNNSVGAYVYDRERVVKYMVDCLAIVLEETRRNETPDGYIMAWLLVSSYMLTTVLVLNACVVWIMFCDISKRCGLGIIHDSFGFGSLLLKDHCDGESKLNDSSCVFVEPKNDAEIDG
ncbi:hypothetical protein H0E87_017299 [Populus deltoides]|uniref:Uncharacterized protein n=1 Tax=Populus deltoides TaxID=3696 RepID=A0A8T2XZN5_POPDE|nr:hypothetical protein H0E87_017299 [Populus deltoides]